MSYVDKKGKPFQDGDIIEFRKKGRMFRSLILIEGSGLSCKKSPLCAVLDTPENEETNITDSIELKKLNKKALVIGNIH